MLGVELVCVICLQRSGFLLFSYMVKSPVLYRAIRLLAYHFEMKSGNENEINKCPASTNRRNSEGSSTLKMKHWQGLAVVISVISLNTSSMMVHD